MKVTPESIQKACKLLETVLIQKNHDYGSSFEEQFNEYGLTSSMIRLDDKLRRLKTLSKTPQEVAGESKADTLLDTAGYALLSFICQFSEPQHKKPPYADLDD